MLLWSIGPAQSSSGQAYMLRSSMRWLIRYEITLLLADFTNKALYRAASVGRPTRYSARYRLTATDGAELTGGTMVLFGPFNYCPAETFAVSVCPNTFAPDGGDPLREGCIEGEDPY